MRKYSQGFQFLDGEGELCTLMRAHDWSATPLGALENWPPELVTVVGLMLNARYPAVVVWGPEHTFLYNDAYAYILGTRHPAALGRSFADGCPKVWAELRPTIEAAMAGQSVFLENEPVTVSPDGVTQQRWFTSSYTPVSDRHGNVLGIFNAGFETTAHVVQERRSTFQLAMADRLHSLSLPQDILAMASEMLGLHLNVSRLVYAEVDDAKGTFFIRREWAKSEVTNISGEARRLDDFGPEVVALLRAGQPMVVQDIAEDPRTSAHADSYASIGVRANLAVPLVKAGRLAVVLSLHSAQPRRWTDADVQLVQDVAERTWMAVETLRAEAELQDTQAWLSAMFDSLPVGVGIIDATGSVKLANHFMHRYMPTLLLPSNDPVRKGRWRLFEADGSPIAAHDFPAARASRGERVVPGVKALYTQDDGREVWTEVAAVPIRDAENRITGRVLVVHEIDALKRTEEELRRSQERYRALFLGVDSGFCIVQVLFDSNGMPVDFRYIETSPTFEAQTGLKDVVGKTLRELVPAIEPFWAEEFGAIVRSGKPARFERYSNALGRWFDSNAFPIGDPQDHQLGVLFTNSSDRHRIDQELRQLAADLAESNRRQSEFLAVLAHELRNPLAPILTSLELMRLRPDHAASSAGAREVIERQTKQMVHLIDDLLDLARVTSGKIEMRREFIDLHAAVATAVETSLPLIVQAGHELSMQLHNGALPMWADATRLAQIVSNLLTNAAKYTPRGGKISLVAQKQDDEVIVSVADNGIGIPEDALSSIFEMFSQVKSEGIPNSGGLGIGLALVRQLVSLQGGTVSASSKGPGLGSTFVVRLPLAAEGAIETQTLAPSSESDRKLRILITDDNMDAAHSLAALLEIYGHETRVAYDGPQALKAISENPPDVVFLDLGMPGMTGYEVARQIRNSDALKGVVLVALTGWGAESDRTRTRESGFDGHLTKPVSPEEMLSFLDSVRPDHSS